MRQKLIHFYFAAIILAMFAINGAAQNTGKELRKAVDRVDDASSVISEIMQVPEKSIPRDLLDKAEAVVIFPGVLKAAFIVGGQGGTGVVVRRQGTSWSAPGFIRMGGGSFGAQIGGQKTDYVLLIMNEKGLKGLMEDKFEMGGEGSVSAGPVGRTAAATTNATLDAEILSYSRSKGLFAGVSLKGVVITPDKDMNMAVYQKALRDIIGSPALASADAPATMQKLANTLNSYEK